MYSEILKTIVFKELMGYCKSAKFQVGFLIILISIILSTVININNYVDRLNIYSAKKFFIDSDLGVNVYKPPHTLSIFAQGKETKLGMRAHLSDGYIPSKTTGHFGRLSKHDLMTGGLLSFDYVFIVKVLLSLFVIFFSYDIVSREKTHGTLKLALSNSISRHVVLFGKSLAGAVVIFGSLCVALLAALAIVITNPHIALTSSDIIRLSGMLMVSFIYLLFFYTLSILISVLVNTPSVCLSVLLQLWLLMIVIYPNMSTFIVDTSYALPSEETLGEQRYNAIIEIYKKRQYAHEYDELNKQAEAIYKIENDYNTRLKAMANRARAIASISPAVLLDEVLARLACTGINDHERFLSHMYLYWEDTLRFKNIDPSKFDKNEALHVKRILNLPGYVYFPESITDSISGSIFPVTALIILIIMLHYISYISFMRKDVR